MKKKTNMKNRSRLEIIASILETITFEINSKAQANQGYAPEF